jgi:hypothetical protein
VATCRGPDRSNSLMSFPSAPLKRKLTITVASAVRRISALTYEEHLNGRRFAGSTRPCIKTKDDWWNAMEYVRLEWLSEAEQRLHRYIGRTVDGLKTSKGS